MENKFYYKVSDELIEEDLGRFKDYSSAIAYKRKYLKDNSDTAINSYVHVDKYEFKNNAKSKFIKRMNSYGV